MNCILLLTLLLPVSDVDVSWAFEDVRHNGSRQAVFISNDNRYFFSALELPDILRVDPISKSLVYEGEQLFLATIQGPTIITSTMSQSSYLAPATAAPGIVHDQGYVVPAGVYSPDKLLAATVSGGFRPHNSRTRVPKRIFGVSIIRLKERGQRPNTDLTFPSDPYGWYEIIDVRVDQGRATAELLVAHSPGNDRSRLVIEAYTVVDKQLRRCQPSQGAFAHVNGRTMSNPIPVLFGVSGHQYQPLTIAVDPDTGIIVSVERNGKVVVIGATSQKPRASKVPGAFSAFFANGSIYLRCRTSTFGRRVYRYDGMGNWQSLGDFDILGLSSNGIYWLKYFPEREGTERYMLGSTPPQKNPA